MVDFNKYAQILGDVCKNVFQQMTVNIDVGKLQVKEEQRQVTNYVVIHKIPFQEENKKIAGEFVLAFTDEQMAVLVACSIAEKIGMSVPEEYNDAAIDMINEFLNTVVGLAISAWDREKLRVKFALPQIERNVVIEKKKSVVEKSFLAVLHLSVNFLVFRVNFVDLLLQRMMDKKIVFIGDPGLTKKFVTVLDEAGFLTETCPNVSEAAKILIQAKPSLVCMDAVASMTKCLAAVSKIRATHPYIKIVLIGDEFNSEDSVTAKTLKVSEVMSPLTAGDDILKAVINLLR